MFSQIYAVFLACSQSREHLYHNRGPLLSAWGCHQHTLIVTQLPFTTPRAHEELRTHHAEYKSNLGP